MVDLRHGGQRHDWGNQVPGNMVAATGNVEKLSWKPQALVRQMAANYPMGIADCDIADRSGLTQGILRGDA
mgnify:CR=1 FL=1